LGDFAVRQREPRLYDAGFLKFLKQKPCCICGKVGETEAAHIRIGLFAGQMKPHDKYATPLCIWHHRRQHTMNEENFWEEVGFDPFDVAEKLYAEYDGDGGKPRASRKVRPRKPKHQRAKIKGRSRWPKRSLRSKSF